MVELKPCPFCGGEPELIDRGDFYWVYCESCDALGGKHRDESKAVEAWNQRAALDAAREERDALIAEVADIGEILIQEEWDVWAGATMGTREWELPLGETVTLGSRSETTYHHAPNLARALRERIQARADVEQGEL